MLKSFNPGAALLASAGFAFLDAVQYLRADAIWQHFCNSPFNIVALETFVQWIHPQAVAGLDPTATHNEIFSRFTPIEAEGPYVVSLI